MSTLLNGAQGLSPQHTLSKFGYPISPPSESLNSFDGGLAGEYSQETIYITTDSNKPKRKKPSRLTTLDAVSRRRPGGKMPDTGLDSDVRGHTGGVTESGSDEVSVRRERGKLAQRAFRQRQIDMIRILKDENAKLKEAILSISTAAYRSQRDLKDAITEACRIAELNPSGTGRDGSPGQGDDDFDHHHHGSGSVSTHSPRPSSAQPLSSSSYAHFNPSSSPWSSSSLELRSPHASTPQSGLVNHGVYGFETAHNHGYMNNNHGELFVQPMGHVSTMPLNEMRNMSTASFPSMYSQGYAEPPPRGRTPEMIAFDPSMNTSGVSQISPTRPEHGPAASHPRAPDDIMPYLGARAYSVGGQVYWASLGYAWQILRTLEMSYPSPSPEILGTIYSLFHIDVTSPQSVSVVKDHLYRRLAFRKQRPSIIAGETPPQQQQQHHHSNQHFQPQAPPSAAILRDRSMGSGSSNSTVMDSMGSSLPTVTPPSRHATTAAPLMCMDTLMASSTSLAGLDPNVYIPPLAVEEQLRQMLGASFLDLEAALRSSANSSGPSTNPNNNSHPNTGTDASQVPTPIATAPHLRLSISGAAPSSGGGGGGGGLALAAKQVLHTLARQAVFFAEGPRWHPETVANAASLWSVEWR
ncbi:hypothetical protein Micbo1qcDRAFT_170979 [Microdochium bolleyi]|uniref:BZIP domain-containing protein n=1 Tax=Microdochium bolleyi TaxID=196109 RepID=A0A136JJF1_9PEZI|nr:hypothetical protein Micbo1qcDRAFT_170979 [Microdochium bolleyi]